MAGRLYKDGTILGQGFIYDATHHISFGGFNSFKAVYSGETTTIPFGNEEGMSSYEFTLGKNVDVEITFNQIGPDADAILLGRTSESTVGAIKVFEEEQTITAGAVTLDNTPMWANTADEGDIEVFQFDSNNDRQYFSRVDAAPAVDQMIVTADPAGLEFNVAENDAKVYCTYWYEDSDVIVLYDEPGRTPDPIELMVEMRWVRSGFPDGQMTHYFRKAIPQIDQERGASNNAHGPVTVKFSVVNEVSGDISTHYQGGKNI